MGGDQKVVSVMDRWSGLPLDILGLIVRRLNSLPDYQRFACVCHSWNACAAENRHHISYHQPPLLMLPCNETTKTREFASPYESKVYKIRLPELSGKWCCGTSFGWLVTVDNSFRMQLLNPFSRAKVQLPLHPVFAQMKNFHRSHRKWKDVFVFKAVLSSSPLSSDCIVMAIVSDFCKVSFCRLGDEKWTTLEIDRADGHFWNFQDIIWHKGKIYAVHYLNFILVYDVIANQIVEEIELPRESTVPCLHIIKYLVESQGELLHVIRYLYSVGHQRKEMKTVQNSIRSSNFLYQTSRFDVFRLDCKTPGQPSWIKLNSIGNRCLFLGRNQSMSLSVLDFPTCSANSIYFTDDYVDGQFGNIYGCHDIGVYRLENEKVEPFDFDMPFLYTTPLWITPDPR